jgi:hypothetical protein
LASGSTVLVSGASPTSTTLTVTAVNAGGVGVYNTPVILAVSGSGNVTLSPASGNTDVNGKLVVIVTGATSGTATVTATALGATKSQDFTVSASGSEFKITAPSTNPAALTTGGFLTFSVQTGTAAITQVRLSTTIGTWTTCAGGITVNTSVCTLPNAASVTAILNSTIAGLASVQVDGLDAAGTVIVSDSRKVAMSSVTAAAISLQSNVSVLQPSTGTTTNSATITATVRDVSNQPVGNAAVVFSLVSPPGGGEAVSPSLVLSSDGVASTDPIGEAKTTFTSGSLPTTPSGVTIRGRVVGTGTGICGGAGTICADTVMNIGGTAGSIVIGTGTTITDDTTHTSYSLPMSLLVADGNGNPMSNAVVSLSAWPVEFFTGSIAWNPATSKCVITYVGGFPNEDTNKNLIMNSEDLSSTVTMNAAQIFPTLTHTAAYVIDGILTPPSSAAGNLPATVTTDKNGLATFNIVYLKQSAVWINTQITARTTVQGTEATSSLTITLPPSAVDMSVSTCLPSSPYNP